MLNLCGFRGIIFQSELDILQRVDRSIYDAATNTTCLKINTLRFYHEKTLGNVGVHKRRLELDKDKMAYIVFNRILYIFCNPRYIHTHKKQQ